MKMNALGFAKLISFVSVTTRYGFSFNEVGVIADIIDEGITPEALPTDVSRKQVASALLEAQQHVKYGRKIDAIKSIRTVADMDLRTAKYFVELFNREAP